MESSYEESGELEVIDIEYLVYHKESYQGGGGYGEFGGYDITLLKLGKNRNLTNIQIWKKKFISIFIFIMNSSNWF